MVKCPSGCGKAGVGKDKCTLLMSAYVLAGLAMMLNIRLSYSSAPYALIRFRLPENLFSVFVRRIASALELWCLPSMLLGNIIDLLQKGIGGDEGLRSAAGSSSGDGIRGKAVTLYTKANELAQALADPGRSDDAAKVLKFKAGTNHTTEGKLRKLAADLHEKANALAQAVKAANNDNNAAENLANAVGETEGSGSSNPNNLREALRQLHEQDADDSNNLTTKAGNVRDAYNDVQSKFAAVQRQAPTAYTDDDKKAKYLAVVNAWNAFNDVYMPEAQLATAVGDTDTPGSSGQPTNLRQALNQLGSANALSSGVSDKAQNVKTKYGSDWGGLKAAFKLVQAQVDAYTAGGTIKTNKYDQLVVDWNNFNNAYNTGISIAKFGVITVPSIICQWFNFLTYVILLFVYVMGGDTGHLTAFYGTIAVSGFVFGINMTLVYAADWNYTPVYIVGENCFPIVTSFIHYITTLIFGNRRKWNSDYLIVCVDIWVAIIISFVAAVVWTLGYAVYDNGDADSVSYGHIFVEGFDTTPPHWEIISPTLMVIVGMGLVYAIYPGIAPGMIVPFYLIDKIEMVLLIATFFPPVIIALLTKYETTKAYSPKSKYVWHGPNNSNNGMGGWKPYASVHKEGQSDCNSDETDVPNWFWHFFDILLVIKISLAVIFIYSLHYRDSNISRSIVNQPKMSTFLSIVFYMCHEILLALGFAGVIGNNGGTYVVLPAQYVGALFMIFLAFYSEGYIIEYKSHDPAHWPTTAMTKWNSLYI